VFLDGLYGPRPEDGPVKKNTLQVPRWTVGLDVGDKWCHIAVVDRGGKLVEKSRVPTESDALRERFRRSLTRKDRLRVILEAGPHSHWISRLLEEEGNEVIVANPRRLKMIYDSDSKSDQRATTPMQKPWRVWGDWMHHCLGQSGIAVSSLNRTSQSSDRGMLW
jgi:hypothetical protein